MANRDQGEFIALGNVKDDCNPPIDQCNALNEQALKQVIVHCRVSRTEPTDMSSVLIAVQVITTKISRISKPNAEPMPRHKGTLGAHARMQVHAAHGLGDPSLIAIN